MLPRIAILKTDAEFAMLVVELKVPDLKTLSDKEIADFALHRDGRWSEQTRTLLKKFQAEKLDLNSGWAWTPQVWACPCCKRVKPDIVRKTPAGVLLCRLELHHDHLVDKAKKTLSELCPRPDELADAIQLMRAKDAIVPLIERFEKALVCVDCNAAEAAAKADLRTEIEKHFSYSPSEIAKFISCSPNRPHTIDIRQARNIWIAAEPDFNDRLDFAQRMARRLASGKHHRELSLSTRGIGPLDDRNYIFTQFLSRLPERTRFTLTADLDARSVSNESAGLSKRHKDKTQARSPTVAELKAMEFANKDKRTWAAAGPDWSCSCCGRSKTEIPRLSNSGKWTAQIHSYRDYELECDPRNLSWRRMDAQSDIIIGSCLQLLICQDCRHVVSEASRRNAAVDSFHLRVSDIRELISVCQNSMHEVDFGNVTERALSNKGFTDAIDDFHAHRDRAIAAAIRRDLLSKSYGQGKAFELLIYEHCKTHNVEPEFGEDYVEWLLAEGDRLKDEHEQERA